jgi:hypothetical protein
MSDLPPDLDRLGAVLTDAVRRAGLRRRHAARRRVAASFAAGLLVGARSPRRHRAARRPMLSRR